MENIIATYTATMPATWFIDFLKMLAECNPNRTIEIAGSRLMFIYSKPNDGEDYTVFFNGTETLERLDWLSLLNGHIRAVQQARAHETAAYDGRTS